MNKGKGSVSVSVDARELETAKMKMEQWRDTFNAMDTNADGLISLKNILDYSRRTAERRGVAYDEAAVREHYKALIEEYYMDQDPDCRFIEFDQFIAVVLSKQEIPLLMKGYATGSLNSPRRKPSSSEADDDRVMSLRGVTNAMASSSSKPALNDVFAPLNGNGNGNGAVPPIDEDDDDVTDDEENKRKQSGANDVRDLFNSNPNEWREGELQRWRQQFRILDTDKDGMISTQEYMKLRRQYALSDDLWNEKKETERLREVLPPGAQDLQTQLLDFNTFLRAVAASVPGEHKPPPPVYAVLPPDETDDPEWQKYKDQVMDTSAEATLNRARALFDSIDSNANGMIDIDELIEFQKRIMTQRAKDDGTVIDEDKLKAEMLRFHTQADANSDNQVDFDEFLVAMKSQLGLTNQELLTSSSEVLWQQMLERSRLDFTSATPEEFTKMLSNIRHQIVTIGLETRAGGERKVQDPVRTRCEQLLQNAAAVADQLLQNWTALQARYKQVSRMNKNSQKTLTLRQQSESSLQAEFKKSMTDLQQAQADMQKLKTDMQAQLDKLKESSSKTEKELKEKLHAAEAALKQTKDELAEVQRDSQGAEEGVEHWKEEYKKLEEVKYQLEMEKVELQNQLQLEAYNRGQEANGFQGQIIQLQVQCEQMVTNAQLEQTQLQRQHEQALEAVRREGDARANNLLGEVEQLRAEKTVIEATLNTHKLELHHTKQSLERREEELKKLQTDNLALQRSNDDKCEECKKRHCEKPGCTIM